MAALPLKIGLALGVPVSIALVIRLRIAARRRRRNRLRATPLPGEWRAVLARNLPVYRILPESLRQQLNGHVQVFLAEKRFVGCGGLAITDEIRVTVAGQACLLLLNRRTRYYPGLMSIVVYPVAYMSRKTVLEGGVATESDAARGGESWMHGSVVLAWDHVRGGARDFHDGQNVVLHEFAHQLDQEDGSSDGRPILGRGSGYGVWGRVCGREFDCLRRDVLKGRKTLLDAYGATDPAEFFAVATEFFFERPRSFRGLHPELYEQLERYYRIDPLTWAEVDAGPAPPEQEARKQQA